MDAYFASVEQRDQPELRGKPIAVGGSGRRGVIAAASYEARKFGVRSAMPGHEALKRCPHLIFVPHRFDVYKAVSSQIHAIFSEYTPLIEPLSLDEAYLDVTHSHRLDASATRIAEEIRKRIQADLNLTASAGVSYNKFLAKVASDIRKPNGQTVIRPKQALAFLEQLPIERFYGVGIVTAQKMHQLGIYSGKDLKQWSQQDLLSKFGKSGEYYYQIVRGQDKRPVNPNRIRKSVGAEQTFTTDLIDRDEMLEELSRLSEKVIHRCQQVERFGRTISLKVRFKDFETISRSLSLNHPVYETSELMQHTQQLLESSPYQGKPVRLLGISLKNLSSIQSARPEQMQFNL